ncbi:response regulator [Novosphingobium album (ex Liu et al. 2023)]|uniref:Response regulator n=1 Tax=Novosphingobium album (ex Liu et al. 2023) TaxID=3031130 RepID=A0ABT5WXR1_9SPHN|nr:response regulator [Novosphingobium album (ex Liu et al. 2023)]MDE8654695.1 response regulator [Novosphingobium album (ex Liu et al. 2023)]
MAFILVVDDEFLLAMMLADILEDEGYKVETAPNGQVALDRIKEEQPTLIITDFMMPIMTGLELAEAVRSDESISDMPIILVSGARGGIARERPEYFQAVFDKPYKNEALLAAVERLVSPTRPS